MNKLNYWLFVCIAASIGLWSCDDEIVVGSGLLEGENLEVGYIDTFTLRARTVEDNLSNYYTFIWDDNRFESVSDSIVGVSIDLYPLGQLQDPLFGNTEAGFYAQIKRSTNRGSSYVANAVVDSFILVLEYFPDNFYGEDQNQHAIKVFKTIDRGDVMDTLDFDFNFTIDPTPIGELDLIPDLDSVFVYEPTQDTLRREVAQLRIPLDKSIAESILADSLASTQDSVLREILDEIYISSESENSIISVIPVGTGTSDIYLYYTQNDTTKSFFRYDMVLSTPKYFSERNGSIVNQINDYSVGDSLLYLQGGLGYDVEVDLEDVKKIDPDLLVNHAVLEFFLAEVPGDNTELYTPVESLEAFVTSTEDQNEERLADITALGNSLTIFDGVLSGEMLVDGIIVRKYRCNITQHIKGVLKGLEDPKIRLSVAFETQKMNRSVVFGPGHSQFPMKLKIAFTNP